MKKAIIGDVHGCYIELMDLLDKLNFYEDPRHLYFVGDLIDKGPDPDLVIKFIKQWKDMCTFIKGNHEELHLRFDMHEHRKNRNPSYKNPMKKSDRNKFPDFHNTRDKIVGIKEFDALKFLDNSNFYHYILEDNIVLVHGGLEPGVRAENMPEKTVCRVRQINSKTKRMVSLDEATTEDPWWTDLYTGDETVIYGHAPFIEPRISYRSDGSILTAGIDTSCVYGNKLTAYILPEKEFVSVPAHKIYCARDINNE